MAVKKNGLGKGLDSLIVNKQGTAKKADHKSDESGVMVNINKVEPNREQPRKISMRRVDGTVGFHQAVWRVVPASCAGQGYIL